MGILRTDSLKEGMILADDVKDMKGKLLLAKGQELEARHIRIFKIWGVTEVNVVGNVGNEENPEPDVSPERIEKIKEKTKPFFCHVDPDHPAIKEIFRLSVLFRSRNGVSELHKDIPAKQSGIPGDYPKLDVRQKILNTEIKLPEIPSIVFELNEVIVDPLASTDNIAQVVNKSPSLTALLLRIVNSPFYGFPSKIESISRAVTIIGTREISSLALGISMITNFQGIPKEILDMYSFLRHGLACGIMSRLLAAHKHMPQTEQLFVSGLLHDIGRLIVYKYFPGQAKNLLRVCRASNGLLYEAEDIYLGCRHTDIGKYLLREWRLPPALESNIFYHHNPSNAPDPISAAIVHLADIIVNGLGMGSSGEIFVPPLDCEAWDRLGLSTSSFQVAIGQAIHQMVALESFLEG
jgi:HD-like signal output (HDOD) protein